MQLSSNILWTSIVASTIVASFATLLIEYLAKPRLEARKERILDRYRQQRAAIRDLQSAIGLTGQIVGLRPALECQNEREYKILRDRMLQYATDLEKMINRAWEEMAGVPHLLKNDWMNRTVAVAIFAALVQTDQVPNDEAWSEAELSARQLEKYSRLLINSRWHWLRRRNLVRQIAMGTHR